MSKLLVWTFLLVVGLVGATVSATPTKECVYNNYRLPKDIVPKHYDLALTIDTEADSYHGSVIIELEVIRDPNEQLPKDIIVLNLHPDVEIGQVTYMDLNPRMSSSTGISFIKVKEVCRHQANELLVIQLEEALPDRAKGKLKVSLRAKFRADNTGIYRSKYTTKSSQESHYVSTDFKPNRARRAFPCLDEPSFKATFKINLIHDSTKVALANTALVYKGNVFDLQSSKFEKTPPMSTYLVAFAIGEFDHIEVMTPNGLKIRVYTPVGKSEQARFALDTAVKAVNYLENYFAIPFPLKKLDLLTGVERNSGASENWALIICKERLILFEDRSTSPLRKAEIAQAVAQGVAHQWFGNLVTMNWWTDLWLDEGMGAWIGAYTTSELYPEEEWGQDYLIEKYQKALDSDSQANVQPVRVLEVGRDIYGSFDAHAFVKSNAIIKFLHDVCVGPENFMLGIRLYLTKYQYQNADASDLWRELATVSGLPVYQIIKSWTEQPGHPIVHARLSQGGANRLILEQQRERPVGVTDTKSDPQTWIIPLKIRNSEHGGRQRVRILVLDQAKSVVDLSEWFDIKRNKNLWLKLNDDSSGFYRVLYSVGLMERLQEPSQSRQLSPANKIGLIDDLKALYSRGSVGRPTFLETLGCQYAGETEGSIVGQVASAYALLPYRPRDKLAKLSKRILLYPVPNLNSSPEETILDSRVRLKPEVMTNAGLVKAIGILLQLDYGPLAEELLNVFNEEKNETPLSIRGFIYETVVLRGSPQQLEELKSFLNRDDIDGEERDRITTALNIEPMRRTLAPLLFPSCK